MTLLVFLNSLVLIVNIEQEKRLLVAIGLRIRKERLINKMTQAQLAFELGTSTKHYQRIEYGEINSGVLTFYKIAEILEVPIEKIFL